MASYNRDIFEKKNAKTFKALLVETDDKKDIYVNKHKVEYDEYSDLLKKYMTMSVTINSKHFGLIIIDPDEIPQIFNHFKGKQLHFVTFNKEKMHSYALYPADINKNTLGEYTKLYYKNNKRISFEELLRKAHIIKRALIRVRQKRITDKNNAKTILYHYFPTDLVNAISSYLSMNYKK